MPQTDVVTERLRQDHLNWCHPEPHYHNGCPLCEAEDRVRPYYWKLMSDWNS